QQEIPAAAIAAAAEGARAAGALFCLNAAPARGPIAVCPDLLVVNRYEHEQIGRYDGLVALTLGAQGAVLIEGSTEVARAVPPQVDAVDGTAAGDAFCAALVLGLVGGLARAQALARACAVGAIADSRHGAQPSLPTAADVDAILAA